MALAGAGGELAAERRMDESMGLAAEALHTGTPGRLMRASKAMTVAGAAVTAAVELMSPARASSRWARAASVAAGAALVAGSVCTRFAIFGAGQESARDPKYTVVPQRARLDRREAAAHGYGDLSVDFALVFGPHGVEAAVLVHALVRVGAEVVAEPLDEGGRKAGTAQGIEVRERRRERRRRHAATDRETEDPPPALDAAFDGVREVRCDEQARQVRRDRRTPRGCGPGTWPG